MMKSSRKHINEIRVASDIGDHLVDEAAASSDSLRISSTIIVIGQSYFDTLDQRAYMLDDRDYPC